MSINTLQHPFNGLPLNGRGPGVDNSRELARIDQVARDLEGHFAKMMVQSMREASFGDSLFPESHTHFRDMHDEQIAKALTAGDGLGLAPMIRQQLGGEQPQALPPVSSTGFPLDNYVRPLAALHAEGASREASRALPLNAPAASPSFPVGTAGRPMVHSPDQAPGRVDPSAASTAAAPQWRNPTLEAVRSRQGAASGPEAFVERIWPHAQRAAAELGVDPKVIVAQAALETGWGRRPIGGEGNDANNLFGIKATNWSGRSVAQSTREVYNGVETREVARFRAYDSIEQSFNDYVSLLKNSPRYADVVGTGDGRQFARALQRAGYATDPQYAAKLTAIAEGPTMRRALGAMHTATADSGTAARANRG